MKSFFKKDRIVAIPWLALSIFYLYYISQIPASMMTNDPGPRIFPYIAGGLMLLMSLILFVFPGKNPDKSWMNSEEKRRLLILCLVYLGYVVGMHLIGYTIPTFLMLFITCTLFSAKKSVPLWIRLFYALLVTVAGWFLFAKILTCRLPVGIFDALNLLPM